MAGLVALLVLSCPMARAEAETTATPVAHKAQEAVILTVTGLDGTRFPGGEAQFDLSALRQMDPVSIATSSVWTSGTHRYTGVMLRTLADRLAIGDATLVLHALNDYAVTMPLAEAGAEAPLLAFEMDGAPMSVRGKGPIWVIYPYDAGPQYRTDTSFARSVWQLDRIDVLR